MGFFDKKICAICGGEIGMFGNRKLSDGNLCKNCASKLSPFMTDRRQSTVEEIRRHLAYREQNARVLLGVHPTRVFGHGLKKIYVDQNQGVFFVTEYTNYMSYNPDVISVSQVIGIRPKIHENREELYHHDREGRRVPYMPPRFRVEYRFDLELTISSPYFQEIELEFSDDRPDSPISALYRSLEAEIADLMDALNPANYATLAPTADVRPAPTAAPVTPAASAIPTEVPAQPANGWTCACGQINSGKFCVNCGARRPKVYRCDKCGWQPDDPNKLPKFCPNCGDPFNDADVG